MTDPNPVKRKPSLFVPRQSPQPTFGEMATPLLSKPALNPNLYGGISCGSSDTNPRSLYDTLYQGGPAALFEEQEHWIRSSSAGTIMIREPGGDDIGGLIQFDQITRCRDDKRIHAGCGDHEEWKQFLIEIKKTGRRTAMYLGAVMDWDGLSTQQIVYKAHQELDPFIGALDELFIDSACESLESGAYPIVHRVCADLGIQCGAETRPIMGRYSCVMRHKHACTFTKFEETNGYDGDFGTHATTTKERLVLLADYDDPGAVKAKAYLAGGSTICVNVADQRHIGGLPGGGIGE